MIARAGDCLEEGELPWNKLKKQALRTCFRCFCPSHLCLRGCLRLLRGNSTSHTDSQANIWTYIAWEIWSGQWQAGLAKCELKSSYATIVTGIVASGKPVKQSDGDINLCREIHGSASIRHLNSFSLYSGNFWMTAEKGHFQFLQLQTTAVLWAQFVSCLPVVVHLYPRCPAGARAARALTGRLQPCASSCRHSLSLCLFLQSLFVWYVYLHTWGILGFPWKMLSEYVNIPNLLFHHEIIISHFHFKLLMLEFSWRSRIWFYLIYFYLFN